MFSLDTDVIFFREKEEIEALGILRKYLRKLECVECNITREIYAMTLEHRDIEKDIVPDDDGIPDKFPYSISDIFPSFSSFEHFLCDSCYHDDLFLERDSWAYEHRSFLFPDYDKRISIFLDLETDRRDFYDRIVYCVESGSLEVEGDECRWGMRYKV